MGKSYTKPFAFIVVVISIGFLELGCGNDAQEANLSVYSVVPQVGESVGSYIAIRHRTPGGVYLERPSQAILGGNIAVTRRQRDHIAQTFDVTDVRIYARLGDMDWEASGSGTLSKSNGSVTGSLQMLVNGERLVFSVIEGDRRNVISRTVVELTLQGGVFKVQVIARRANGGASIKLK